MQITYDDDDVILAVHNGRSFAFDTDKVLSDNLKDGDYIGACLQQRDTVSELNFDCKFLWTAEPIKAGSVIHYLLKTSLEKKEKDELEWKRKAHQ